MDSEETHNTASNATLACTFNIHCRVLFISGDTVKANLFHQLSVSRHSHSKPVSLSLFFFFLFRKMEEVNLAATAISLNVRLRSSDMPAHMQQHALRFTRSLVDDYYSESSAPKTSCPNPTHLARALKKDFDDVYGPAWHCVVGKNFGSFVTHSPGGFLYFSIESLSVLLFKTEVQLVKES